MKRKERIQLALAAGGGVAAVYGGYATLAWLRFGHAHTRYTTPKLERYMPELEVIEHQRIEVNAPADLAYAACPNLDLARSPVVRLIFATRARVMRADEVDNPETPVGSIDQAQTLGGAFSTKSPVARS